MMKANEQLVSIIIPVFNASKYLKLCIRSLLHQSYKNFEIICVDDGSTDGSINILKSFCNTDSRIKLLRQENSYAGVARNNGLRMASGEFVIFLEDRKSVV